ncbi:MAG: FlgD immunoglobulin-like domain containing protein [bacterium]|nr:FlgD immunoglobulin-like domain containing protein [bacterium]
MKKVRFLAVWLLLTGMVPTAKAAWVTVSDGALTSDNANFSNSNKYGLSEYIYLSSEMTTNGTIDVIQIEMSAAKTLKSCAIYMGQTTKTTFTSTTDWITGLTQVWGYNTFIGVANWNTITLTTPFSYTTASNLAIMFDYDGNLIASALFYYKASTTRHLYRANASDVLPDNPGLGSAPNAQLASLKVNFVSAPPDNPPTILAATAGACGAGITVTWTDASSNETAFIIYRNNTGVGSAAANIGSYVDNSPAFTTGGPYSYQVYATNSAGSNVSGVCTGTATVRPLAPTIVSAVAGACGAGITVTWTDNSSNAQETAFIIYRDNAGIGSVAANIASYVDNTVFTTGGPYSYQVYATNACGSNLSGVCTGTAAVRPLTPTGLSATAGACGAGITVSWTNNTANNETQFTIYRNNTGVGSVAANIASYVDNSPVFTTGGPYSYQVYATNACGSNVSGVCTGTAATPPLAPTILSAVAGACGAGITVTWTDNSSNSQETAFIIYRNTVGVGSAAANIGSYIDTGPTTGGPFSYQVYATNSCGSNVSGVCTGTAAVRPLAPTSPLATAGACGAGITISWTDASNNPQETAFIIYRNGAGVGSVAANIASYVDAGPPFTTGGPYSYQVYATNACGSNVSGVFTGTAATPPTAPTILSAVAGVCGAGITVTWTDNSSNETKFIIYRNGTGVGSANAGIASYIDNSPAFTTGGPFSYQVCVTNACGSNVSGVCTGTAATTPLAPTIGTAVGACNQVTVTWTDNANNETKFIIYRNGTGVGSAAANIGSYIDNSPAFTTGGPFSYQVYATNACGSNVSGVCTGTALFSPPAPTSPTATTDNCTNITITWTDNSSNEDKFVIYRNGAGIGSAAANIGSYVDNITTANAGVYSYYVWSTNSCGGNTSGVCTGIVAGKIDITVPDGGENLTSGVAYSITWTAINSAYGGNVSLDYSVNSGVDWTSIIASTPDVGSYSWSPVPSVTTTTTARVRVLRLDATCTDGGDTSAADFTITNDVSTQKSGSSFYNTKDGGLTDHDDIGYQIFSISDGYLMVGKLYSKSFGIRKMDANGAVTWSEYGGDAMTSWTGCYTGASDNTYIIGGTGTTQCLLTELNSSGACVWAQTYTTSASYEDRISSVILDGSYVVATGYYYAGTVNHDVFAVRALASDGSIGANCWANYYPMSHIVNTTCKNEEGCAIIVDSDGNYVLTGMVQIDTVACYGNSDVLVMKLAPTTGNVTYAKRINIGRYTNYGRSIVQDGSYYVIGGGSNAVAKDASGNRLLVLKMASDGSSVTWGKYLGSSTAYNGFSLIKSSGGDYILAGTNGNTLKGAVVADFTSSGSKQWAKKIEPDDDGMGSYECSDACGRSIIQVADNSYILTGDNLGSSREAFLTRIKSDGTMDASCAIADDAGASGDVTTVLSDCVQGTPGALSAADYSGSVSFTSPEHDYRYVVCGSPFSVEFVGMTANSEVGYISLNWFTETEKDNLKWILHRSENKEGNYTQIAEMPAKGAGPNSYTYPDSTITPGLTYWYKLGDMDNSGNTIWHTPVSAVARLETKFPLSLKLESLNPSNRTVKINYSVPSSSAAPYVNIAVYNSLGQVVKVLVNEKQIPGPYTIYWDGKDTKNKTLGSGEYFCRLKTNGKLTYKLIRMR